MRFRPLLAGTSLAIAATHASADEPHPLVPLAPDAEISESDFLDYNELTFPTAPFVDGEPTEVLEKQGAHLRQEYRIEGTEVATVRLYQSYLDYFESQGFEVVFHGMGDELTDGSARSMLRDGLDAPAARRADGYGYILARSPSADHVVALSFYDRRRDRRIQVDVVEIQEMETFELTPSAPDPEPEAEVEDEFIPSTQDAAELEIGLVEDGRVVVDAILFAFDSDEIKPESADALETVAELMEANANLDLLVVGHTDGVGSFDYNLRLSLDRATSVVAWLNTEHGIDQNRLRPAGAGPMSPITTNRSEDGRAQNRRVELVEIID